ncbi:FHA domain-containing protein [Raoultibacter phocaeensis]|uniref:FHA domain-containing protein n=1 Tax=Raoultibacter phocaeensis TaxID=2479841 RepID=UPI0011180207|nr:FHA domain-containing protein [Raoultibacter phocaeensis]
MSDNCPICSNPLPTGAAVCPTCGFKLLGSTQSFAPLEFSGRDVVCSAPKPPANASLRIVRGPQIETVFKLGETELTIGRSPRCDIFLNDMTVSREHAAIAPDGAGYRISDANSYNGVWINNESIESAVLADGDIVQIGVFCLLYQVGPEA